MNIKSHWLVVTVLAALLGLSVLAAACGGGEEEGAASPAAETGQEASPEHVPGVVHVVLNEWSILGEDGGALEPVGSGDITFEVHNDGTVPHELVVIKTDTDPADLPLTDGTVDEDAAGEVIGEVNEFPSGEIGTGEFHLEPGTYALICNIAGHYQQGMYASVVVE